MRCPSLAELPPPPPDRTGWPWTEESPPIAGTQPRLTLITPSYMQGEFIEQTIRSVLLQGYPDLEYFILDGGSTDGTREIIRKYEPWLAGWRCEKDAGQSAAINEGWERATGEVLGWINSDDWYHPGALAAVGRRFAAEPSVTWVSGAVDDVDGAGVFKKRHPAAPTPLASTLGRKDFGYHQPGMFWRRALVEKVGPLDGKLNYAFDSDFWVRSLLAGFEMVAIPEPVACFREHGGSKTCGFSPRVMEEDWKLFARYSAQLPPEERRQAAAWLRAYEADYLVAVAYTLLRAGGRGQALAYLLRKVSLAPLVRPRRAWLGAFLRILVTGSPPAGLTS
jgi:glycosyltransferase involved in cell wall biosynthesis